MLNRRLLAAPFFPQLSRNGAGYAALIAFHRFFAAIEIALLPAALILRFFGFAVAASVGSDSPRSLAYLARCAAAIFFRDANENFLRLHLPVSDGMAAGSLRPPFRIVRS